MKFIYTLALLAVISMCSVSSAAMRTFTFNNDGDTAQNSDPVGPVLTTLNFSYPTNAFSDDVVNASELGSSAFSITMANTAQPSYKLDNIVNTPNANFKFTFLNAVDASKLVVGFNTGAFASTASGADLPDGTEGVALTQYFDASGSSAGFSLPSATIATVPEPSAFAFGALALAVTGAGRWSRRRFFAS